MSPSAHANKRHSLPLFSHEELRRLTQYHVCPKPYPDFAHSRLPKTPNHSRLQTGLRPRHQHRPRRLLLLLEQQISTELVDPARTGRRIEPIDPTRLCQSLVKQLNPLPVGSTICDSVASWSKGSTDEERSCIGFDTIQTESQSGSAAAAKTARFQSSRRHVREIKEGKQENEKGQRSSLVMSTPRQRSSDHTSRSAERHPSLPEPSPSLLHSHHSPFPFLYPCPSHHHHQLTMSHSQQSQ